MSEIEIQQDQDTITVKIDFEPDSGDPTRIFNTMAQLIESLQDFDQELLSQFSLELHSDLVLHDVERGSLKANLRSIVSELPDEALENAEWKKLLGHFLRKGKYALLKWTSEQEQIEDRRTLEPLEGELLNAARETEIHGIPAYKPIPTERLLQSIKQLNDAASNLGEGDSVSISSDLGELPLRGNLAISTGAIRDILTAKVVESTTAQTLLVKKPDYLGQSMWSFRYKTHGIEAKILDHKWLTNFQSQHVSLRPGDALRVSLREELFLGQYDEVVAVQYEIIEVYSVVSLVGDQGELYERN